MKQISKTFLKGLIAVAPITITVYFVYWLGVTAELVLGDIFKVFLPDKWYVQGMGFVAGLAVVFFVGGFLQSAILHKLFWKAERYVLQIPFIKSIYTAIRDMISIITNEAEDELRQVVLVDMPASASKQIGFVTRSDFSGFPDSLNTEGQVAVYLPFGYAKQSPFVCRPWRRSIGVGLTLQPSIPTIKVTG